MPVALAGAGADGDEIVVCGRRENPYALPLYEPTVAGDGLASGMAREIAVGVAQDASAACHARGEACVKPLVVISVPVGSGKKRRVGIGTD